MKEMYVAVCDCFESFPCVQLGESAWDEAILSCRHVGVGSYTSLKIMLVQSEMN